MDVQTDIERLREDVNERINKLQPDDHFPTLQNNVVDLEAKVQKYGDRIDRLESDIDAIKSSEVYVNTTLDQFKQRLDTGLSGWTSSPVIDNVTMVRLDDLNKTLSDKFNVLFNNVTLERSDLSGRVEVVEKELADQTVSASKG